MNRENDLDEFIQRVSTEMQDEVKTFTDESSEKSNARQRAYFKSEKGKAAKKKGDQIRRERLKKAKWAFHAEYKAKLSEFYRNCPEGYEVDHIVPLARGGEHMLENLRYVSKEVNKRKFLRTGAEADQYLNYFKLKN